MQEEDFKKYENSFNEDYFKECLIEKYENTNNLNPRYYEKTINKWYEQRCKELKNNNQYKELFDLLKSYLLDLKFLFTSIIELYEAVERYNNIKVRLNRVYIKEDKVITNINDIESFKIVIGQNLIHGFNSNAKNIKTYIILELEEMIFILKDIFHIDILKSPLKKIFKKNIKIIEKSTSQIDATSTTKIINKKIYLTNNTIDINETNKPDKDYQYYKITTLFAKGDIYDKKSENKTGRKYYYKEKVFNNVSDLIRYLKDNRIVEMKHFRQYVEQTFAEMQGEKDIYNINKPILKNTYNYCVKENIEMTENFKNKYAELNN